MSSPHRQVASALAQLCAISPYALRNAAELVGLASARCMGDTDEQRALRLAQQLMESAALLHEAMCGCTDGPPKD